MDTTKMIKAVVATAAAVFFMGGACASTHENADTIMDSTREAEDEGQDQEAQEADAVECSGGFIPCSGECIDSSSNHSHCGACDNACEPYEVCSAGSCLLECPSGRIGCEGTCVDSSVDIENCGDCGVTCHEALNAHPVCEGGRCSVACNPGWSDRDDEIGCETNCSGTSVPETCNGEDDDCDGEVDEGFACRKSAVTSCATACGSVGTGTCSESCSSPPPDACTPPGEICNGEDDDCDGSFDEGFACRAGASQSCATSCGSIGGMTCTASCTWSPCLSPPEACNGVDDDCDGQVDEDLACEPGATRECVAHGSCPGSQVCRSDCIWSECSNPSWSCTDPGESESCVTSCGSTGTRTCTEHCTWGACRPPLEQCSGVDDDCDGSIDEGFECALGSTETCSVTGCGEGTTVCGSDCTWGECTNPSWQCAPGETDTTCNPSGTVCPGRRTCRIQCTWNICIETCSSPSPYCCPGGCVNLLTDPNNCGACDNVCDPGDTCSGGACQIQP